MKEKVEQEEALSNAYGSIVSNGTSIDDEINNALKDTSNKVSDSLTELKEKIAANKKE